MSPGFERTDKRCVSYVVKCVVWAGLAAISLAFAFHQAVHPNHSDDLMWMYGWVVKWLQGENVYADLSTQADYPPHAIVLLSLFTIVDAAWLPIVWATTKIVLAPAVAYLAVRLVWPSATWTVAVLPIAMFCSWGSVRISLWTGQIALLLLGAGLLSVMLARRRPVLSGILCGVALIKPHFGAPFLMWAMLARQFTVVASASGVVLGGLMIFALRTSTGPMEVVASYWQMLTHIYVGEDRVSEHSALSARLIFHAVIESDRLADAAHLVTMAVLLVWLCRQVFAARESLGRSFDAVLLSALCTWSLLAFYNQPYNGVLLLPAMTWLVVGQHRPMTWREEISVTAIQLVLMASVAWRLSDQFMLHAFSPVLALDMLYWKVPILVLDNFWRIILPVVIGVLVFRVRRQERSERCYGISISRSESAS